MKKICSFLLITSLLCSLFTCYAADSNVILKFQSSFKTKQGVDNWYYCGFGSETIRLQWNDAKTRWDNSGSDPTVRDVELSPSSSNGTGYQFKAPEKGMILLRGEVVMPYVDSSRGDGVTATIRKGTIVLWTGTVKYGKSAKYEIKTSVRKGENIDFIVDCGKSLGWDWTRWWPTVEYLSEEYVAEEEIYQYFQKNSDGMKQLFLDETKDGYFASDNIAFMDSQYVMPSDNYSMVKRLIVPEEGRYRVLCRLNKGDMRSGGNIVRIYQNNIPVWEQYCTELDDNVVDVRMFSKKDDIIDVEVAVDKYDGYNCAEWTCDITKYVGTISSMATSSKGYLYSVKKEYPLSSLISGGQENNGMRYYSVKNHKEYPMVYETSTQKWKAPFENEVGYIKSNEVYPGTRSDSVFEWTIGEDAILHFDGKLNISSEGVLCKLYQNDKLIWSNRVGGERAVRWDEPYDVSYFNNELNVFANAKNGDKFKFTFNQWKKIAQDNVGISDIRIKHVSGDVLSETTKWKLKNSIIIDTYKKGIIKNGVFENADILVRDGVIYISESDLAKIYTGYNGSGEIINGKMYFGLRAEAERRNDNVVWCGNHLAIVYGGIPNRYSFAELSEIATMVNGGVMYE